MEEKVFNITIDSDPQTRQGSYADRVLATSEGPVIGLTSSMVTYPWMMESGESSCRGYS